MFTAGAGGVLGTAGIFAENVVFSELNIGHLRQLLGALNQLCRTRELLLGGGHDLRDILAHQFPGEIHQNPCSRGCPDRIR